MHTLDTKTMSEFTAYRQVVRGAYNPVNAVKTSYKSVLYLVRSANTLVICSSSVKDDVVNFASTFDTTSLGYYATNDVVISYAYNFETKIHEAVAKPRVTYLLSEDIALPDPPDEKAKVFQDFFSDELERIKLRAEYVMHHSVLTKDIRSYAVCNLQSLRKLFHDSRLSFNKLCSRNGSAVQQSDLFIFYTLNLFVIRCIVFYVKYFKPFLNEVTPIEQELRNTFHNEMPRVLKYPWLFNHRPPLYSILSDNCSHSSVDDSVSQYPQGQQSNSKLSQQPIDPDLLALQQYKHSIPINGSSNIIIDAFYQMMHERKIKGLPYLDTESPAVAAMLSFFMVDKKGQPLKAKTIRSVLKPSNTLKRPSNTDKNKIKLKNDDDVQEDDSSDQPEKA